MTKKIGALSFEAQLAEYLKIVVPAGSVQAFAGTTPPTDWLICDGRAVSRTVYADLFAAIGTAHGSGDGSTTFNLPDYRGQFLRGRVDISNITGSGTASNIWQKKVLRFKHNMVGTWDYTNGTGMTVDFIVAAGASLRTTPDSWVSGNFMATSNQVNGVDNTANDFMLADICLAEDNESQVREPEFQLAARDVLDELQLCQRYYEVGMVASSGTAASTFSRWWSSYKTEKRSSSPVVTYTIITGQNASAPGTIDVSNQFGAAGRSNGGSINDWTAWTFRADAEL